MRELTQLRLVPTLVSEFLCAEVIKEQVDLRRGAAFRQTSFHPSNDPVKWFTVRKISCAKGCVQGPARRIIDGRVGGRRLARRLVQQVDGGKEEVIIRTLDGSLSE